MRRAALALLLLAAPLARAQSDYQPPAHVRADEVAIGFLAGRYITPVTCKRKDGSQVEAEDSVALKSAPDAGGGAALRATFFGLEVADAEHCYSAVERRLVDRRGSIILHYRTRNRPDWGLSDFRRAALAGPLTYNAHRGALQVSEIGDGAATNAPRTIEFDGGDARLVVEGIVPGTDGAKLVAQFEAKRPPDPQKPRRMFVFRFIAKDASEFVFYAIEDDRRFR